jgi:hypothetical protein
MTPEALRDALRTALAKLEAAHAVLKDNPNDAAALDAFEAAARDAREAFAAHQARGVRR